jgi:hypothetical protein
MNLSFSSGVAMRNDKMIKNNNLLCDILPVTAGMFAAGMLLSACVTINIYFPAAAAEKAADKIIEEVWQLEHEKKDD